MPLVRVRTPHGWARSATVGRAAPTGALASGAMFATLLGPLPRPPVADDAPPEAVLEAILAVQTEHGLEPLTDGGWPIPEATAIVPPDPVSAWRSTAERADRLVKAVVPGPYSAASSGALERGWLLDLADAGCRWIEIHEPDAVRIGDDLAARTRFADVHRALTADLDGVHLSLAITGGSGSAAGIETILAGAYASLALDLIDGPDNWDLAVATPGDRGIVAGVVGRQGGGDDGPEILLWAAGYAASTGGRGAARVGLATAGSLASLPWEAAAEKVRRLGAGARLATAPREERLAALDPHAIDARSAALGRYAPRPPRRRTGGPPPGT